MTSINDLGGVKPGDRLTLNPSGVRFMLHKFSRISDSIERRDRQLKNEGAIVVLDPRKHSIQMDRDRTLISIPLEIDKVIVSNWEDIFSERVVEQETLLGKGTERRR